MITLINTNLMQPPIAPVGLDYVASALNQRSVPCDVLDLGLSDDPWTALNSYFDSHSPQLIGLSFRNVDDCFWPGGDWFVPSLGKIVDRIRPLSEASIVLGGVGYSIFPERIVETVGADFGLRGDGEYGLPALFGEIQGDRRFDRVAGLIWRKDGELRSNPPQLPEIDTLRFRREAIDNRTYFTRGGQIGVETKRGCNRSCLYCADPLAKGNRLRPRSPASVADEVASLLTMDVDVLHLCDSEFNLPREHAIALCEELIRRKFSKRLRWYAYLAVTPFDADLARIMRRAGCVGINFTGDSASEQMLRTYRQPHRQGDLAAAVNHCRENEIAVMIDLLLGGPGETWESASATIDFMKRIAPDCVGAPLGVRVYPQTAMARLIEAEGSPESNPSILRKYEGPVDLLRPTFYISHTLGARPAERIQALIAGDTRFFGPTPEPAESSGTDVRPVTTDHNYNENRRLVDAIANGARGAYWDLLRKDRGC